MRELDSMAYVFIDSDETGRAWLLSNPTPNDPLDLMVYYYPDRGSERPDTPALRRVDYLMQNDVRQLAHDPAQGIIQIDCRELFDNRAADREGSDTDNGREDVTPYLSASCSGLSDSAHGSEIRFTIMPTSPCRTRYMAGESYPPSCQIVERAESTATIKSPSSPWSRRR